MFLSCKWYMCVHVYVHMYAYVLFACIMYMPVLLLCMHIYAYVIIMYTYMYVCMHVYTCIHVKIVYAYIC